METEQPGDPKLIAAAKAEAQKEELKRARRTAIIFGVITSIALISLVYAYVQNGIAKENARVAQELQIKLDNCEREAMKQREALEKSVMIAEKQLKEVIKQTENIEEARKKIKR